jgi:hypothetical protein
MTEVTDEMCRLAIGALKPDRIQGYSTRQGKRGTEWGSPHYIRDIFLPVERQELWRGDSHEEMMERCEIEKMRLALSAALRQGERHG